MCTHKQHMDPFILKKKKKKEDPHLLNNHTDKDNIERKKEKHLKQTFGTRWDLIVKTGKLQLIE